MRNTSLIALVAMLAIGNNAYAGSCVVCPFGMKCTGGTAAPVDNATELQAAKTKLGIVCPPTYDCTTSPPTQTTAAITAAKTKLGIVCPLGYDCTTSPPTETTAAITAAKTKLGIVCPPTYDCTTSPPTQTTAAIAAAKTTLGLPALIPTLPDGVYASNGWYLEAVDPTHAQQYRHIKIKAGTTIVVNGKAITFTANTNKALGTSITAGNDYDICVSNTLDTTSSANTATAAATGIRVVSHNTACTTTTELKIGGFHAMPCTDANTGTLAPSHPYYNAKQGSIMPNSVWTLKHHPVSIEGGYVYDPAMGHWVMIYLATLVSNKSYYQDTIANNTTAISTTRYDSKSCRGQTGYCDGAAYPGTFVQTAGSSTDTSTTNINAATMLVSRYNKRVANQMEFRESNDLLAGGGARPLSDAQFSSAASGSIETAVAGTQGYNAACRTFAAPARLNISNIGVIGMTGEYWQDLDVPAGTGSTTSQSGGKGSYSRPSTRVFAGGYWDDTVSYVGSRSRYDNNIAERSSHYAARGMSPDAWR